MKKTKSVGGKEYGASDFAYVGNADDIATWHLPIPDEAHVRDALARFNQTAEIPADKKAGVIRKLLSAAKKYGIDASGFKSEHKATESESSYEDAQDALDQALVDSFGMDTSGYRRFRLVETFPDYVIARGPDGDLYQIPYTLGADDDQVTFGDPQEVETAYVPVEQSAQFSAAASDDGWSWPVQIMEAGWARGAINGQADVPHYFPVEIVAKVAEAANGGRFRRRHPKENEGSGADMPELTAGWTSEAKMSGSTASGKLNLLRSESDLRDKLLAAKEAGKLDLFNVSIFAYFGFRAGVQDGKRALIATSLGKYVGLDLCAEAGAGGKILPYAASRDTQAEITALQRAAVKQKVSSGTTRREDGGTPTAKASEISRSAAPVTGRIIGAAMKESIMKVLEALRKIDNGRASELETEFETVPGEKHFEFFARVTEAAATAVSSALKTDPAVAVTVSEMLRDAAKTAADGQNSITLAKTQEALAEVRKIQFASTLDRKLTESKLPIPAASLVREHFASAVADDKVVEAFIVKTRESFAAFSSVGRMGGSTVEVGRDSSDKIQLAMDAMMGVREAVKDRNVRPFRGIKEAYIFCTGDRDVNFREGGFHRVSEAIATSDFPNILLNSMTKKLIQDYTEFAIVDQLDVLYTKATLGDYKSQDRIRMGYLSDLSTVNEAAVYTEAAKPTDEKISYTISKRGNLITISEETIRNDDLGKIAQYPGRIARAARHTLATFISNFFITPPSYDPDSVSLFHATHNNLGSVALSAAELDARSIILAKQSEKDSTNRLGLRLWGIMIPVDLKPTALQINNNMNGTNNYYQYFGANMERIIVNPLMTDVNDWIGFCDPSQAPFLEIGFLDGYQAPQVYLANLPTQGTQFTNDQIQYKVKHVYGGKPIDFRGVFKEVV